MGREISAIITQELFEKWGCVECGCDLYCDSLILNEKGKQVDCPECGQTYIISSSSLQKHPREGIKKHAFKEVDLRPSTLTSEYVNESHYFNGFMHLKVTSKASAIRLQFMINSLLNRDAVRIIKGDDPQNIEVNFKIGVIRGVVLESLIDTEEIITKENLEYALTGNITVMDSWLYYIDDYLMWINDKIQNEKNKDIEKFPLSNYLDKYELMALSNIFQASLQYGDIEFGVILARHIVDIYSSHFNTVCKYKQFKTRDYNYIRENTHKLLVDMLNNHYKSTNQLDKLIGKQEDDTFKGIKKLSEDERIEFNQEWKMIAADISNICNIIPLSQFESYVDKPYLYCVYSLFGLFTQVNKYLVMGNYENAIIAIEHVTSQSFSKFFVEIQRRTLRQDLTFMTIKNIYANLLSIKNKYYTHQEKTLLVRPIE